MPETDVTKITVFSADGTGRVLSLTGTVLTIGRTPDNDLVLDDPQVSRRHAELRAEGGSVLFTDVGSTNGTFVEGQRLQPDSPLRLLPQTEVRIGSFTLVLQDKETAQAQSTTEQPADEIVPDEAPPPPLVPLPPPFIPAPQPEESIPTFPAPLPVGVVSQYLRELPAPFQESDFLGRYLLLFEALWEPMERRQDHISLYFDPRTCPVTFLPYLAEWVGIELAAHWPEQRKRRLLREAAELYRWRGTVYGLVRLVELCVGVAPTVTEVEDEPFTLQISLPAPGAGGTFPSDDREAVRRIIERHKPAHVGYYLNWTEPS